LSGPAVAHASLCRFVFKFTAFDGLNRLVVSGVLESLRVSVAPQCFFMVEELINAWKAVKMDDAH
jgi:hypothetical protein